MERSFDTSLHPITDGRRGALVIAVAIALSLVALSTPASAGGGSSSFTATCNPDSFDYSTDGVRWDHKNSGTISVKQTSSLPSVTSHVKLRSDNGNFTGHKAVSDGGTVSWQNVLPSKYKVYARAASKTNCNGISPGSGNYTFRYTITTVG
jgi:hypothetical protein